MEKETGKAVLGVHAANWLGETGGTLYVILVGGGLFGLLVSGACLLLKSRAKGQPRFFHRIVGAIFLLPLAATAITGVAFKVGEEWLHLSDDVLDIFMSIHQGSWLGKTVRPFYVLALGIGLLSLILTGIQMTGLFRKKTQPAPR